MLPLSHVPYSICQVICCLYLQNIAKLNHFSLLPFRVWPSSSSSIPSPVLLKQAPNWPPRFCLWPPVVYSHSSTQNSVGGPCLKVKAKISTIDFFPLVFLWLPLLFSYLFTVLQPHWPLCCSLNLLGTLLPHGLCLGYFLCLKNSSSR